MLGMLARAFMIRRILGSGRRSRHGGRYGGRYGGRHGHGRGRGRTGFFGPMPYYSRQTRGGSRVSVGGCCLPIPLGLLTSLGLGARLLLRR
jgi:hypothetical protein